MKRALFIIVLALLPAISVFAAATNILLIIADDYGVDSSSLYNSTTNGASLPPTPNLTTLAQNGVLFANGYANPVCSPTRACLITGRYSFRTGIGDAIAGAGSPILQSAEFTLPEAFTANLPAYQLAQFGKWHLANGTNMPSTLGGWPHFAGSLIGALASYTNWSKTVDGVTTAGYTNYATSDIVDDTLAWIQARGTNAWFAWVAFNAPHTPLHKPPNALCPHYTGLSGTQADINANPRPYFEAMTEAMDIEIGRLLSTVSLTNTTVIFLGDNGTTPSAIQPPYPASRGKSTLYEGGVKVPFIIAGPGVVNAGRTNATPVHAVDLYATILGLAGMNTGSSIGTTNIIDSVSLLPLLQSPANQSRYVYVEQFGTNFATNVSGRALRNTQFKLIRFDDGHEEFYDLLADPYESTNLLAGVLTGNQQANYYSLILKLGDYQATLTAPTVTGLNQFNSQFSATVQRSSNLTYSLWRASALDTLAWSPVTNTLIITNSLTSITLTDTNANGASQFYRIGASAP